MKARKDENGNSSTSRLKADEEREKNIHFAFNRTVTKPTKLPIRRVRLRESAQPSRDR
jgi:hypothetical protein